jgi:2-dehydro-3-deoxyphosphogluconate aldolase/(4S)-4-hydroxy-2-oxoglutarate aldolase
MPTSTLSQILKHKIVAILRGFNSKDILSIANALNDGGVKIVEVTLNSTDALPVIENLSHTLGDKMQIGAGTVLTSSDAKSAISAGAKFLVSPSLDINVIKTAKDAGVVSIPGAFTPTEILMAFRNGADVVKVFPTLSAEYIKNILAPLNQIPLMPTGGISLTNIKDYIKTGAVAFGIGSSLADNKAIIDEAFLQNIIIKARQFTEAVHS